MKMAAKQILRFLTGIAPQGSCSRKPPRRARSPALHCGHERAVSHETLPPARPGGGPMQSIGPYAGGMAVRPRFHRPFALHCPADVHARRARSAKAQTLRVSAGIAPQGSCSRKPPRRARLPALHCSRERAVSHETLPPARPGGEPMQSIGPYAGEMAVCRSPVPLSVCLVLPGGRSCPPGKVCESGNLAGFGKHYSARLLQPQAPAAGEIARPTLQP